MFGGRRRGLRWLAASAGAAVAGATVLAMAPAHADSATVNAQLSLSGVATKANVLGGTTVGVHPGDTVDFRASALPTAGLAKIPALGSLLSGVLDGLLGSEFQVVVTFGSKVPSVGSTTVTLGGPTKGACKAAQDLPVRFPADGTYTFTWTVQYVLPGLLGCSKSSLGATSLNQLQKAGIAINAHNQWVGKIVVAANPPKGGISVQLPGVGAAPSLPVVGQLPGVSLPPVDLPTIGADLPDAGDLPLPGLNKDKSGAGGKKDAAKSDSGSGEAHSGLTVPEMVVPSGYGNGDSGNGAGPIAGLAGGLVGGTLPDLGGGSIGLLADKQIAPALADSSADSGPATAPAAALALSSASPVAGQPLPEAVANDSGNSGQHMPVLLAIVAIIALALVTATFARMYLLRRK